MPFDVAFSVWGIVGFVVLFFAVGLVVMVRAMVRAHEERVRAEHLGVEPLSWRERLRRYEGPVTPDLARLNPPLRVLVEFGCALFGLPGLGWVLSARVVPGAVLLLVGPLFAWCLYPVYLSISGRLATNVYAVVDYLPFVAAISAGTLAVFEARTAIRRRRAEASS